MGRNETDLVKYISKSVGTSFFIKDDFVQFKKKMNHQELDEIVEKYILQYVICETCNNPETIESAQGMSFTDGNYSYVLGRICKACGFTSKNYLL